MLTAGAFVQLRCRSEQAGDTRFAAVVIIQHRSGVMLELLDPVASLPISDCEIWSRRGTVQQRHVGYVVDAMDVGRGRGPQVSVVFQARSLQAERRGGFRYLLDREVKVQTIERAQEWRAVDVGLNGLGLASIEWMPVGTRVAIAVSHLERAAIGTVEVRHIQRSPRGLVRFGVFVPPDETALRALLAEVTGARHVASLRALQKIRERVFKNA